MAPDNVHIFVVSDGTGATASAIVKAGLVMFRGVGELAGEVSITRFPNTRTRRAVDRILDRAVEEDAFVVHTFGSNELRKTCEAGAREKKVPTADVIGPLIDSFSKFLKLRPESRSGLLHQVDETYFRRIDAVEFAVMHDDSRQTAGLPFADIVLVGVSRTGKTPLSVYLALEGWRVANVALVKDRPLPPELEKVPHERIVGLVCEPSRLADIRRSRLRTLGQEPTDYGDPDRIEEEIQWSRALFRRQGWTILDTTEKSIEESANAVLDRVIGKDRSVKEMGS
jgi:[pyruvate, water dikinase]-phosphate phosphotransferase / [pyruvate, water dikinase] kinase